MTAPEGGTLPFTRLRQYQIIRRIGQGHVGEVYEAVDPELHRSVALKLLAVDVQGDADRQWRFYTQAAAAARLVHPNIVQMYYVGDDQGRCFYAMEYVAGGSLAGVLERRERPDVAHTTRMIGQMLAGLVALHRRNLIHGNLKPSNILLDTAQGRVLLSDFGQAESPRGSETLPAAESADPALDLAAVGGVACRLLIGDAAAAERQSPESLAFSDDVPHELATLVRRLLPAAERRYMSAQAALHDLQPLLAAADSRSAPQAGPFLAEAATGDAEAGLTPACINRSTVIALPTFEILPPLPEGLLEAGDE